MMTSSCRSWTEGKPLVVHRTTTWERQTCTTTQVFNSALSSSLCRALWNPDEKRSLHWLSWIPPVKLQLGKSNCFQFHLFVFWVILRLLLLHEALPNENKNWSYTEATIIRFFFCNLKCLDSVRRNQSNSKIIMDLFMQVIQCLTVTFSYNH